MKVLSQVASHIQLVRPPCKGGCVLKKIVVVCCSVPLLTAASFAQSQVNVQKWPERPVRIVIGFSAGSSTDFTARVIGPKLSELWKQPVV